MCDVHFCLFQVVFIFVWTFMPAKWQNSLPKVITLAYSYTVSDKWEMGSFEVEVPDREFTDTEGKGNSLHWFTH